MTASLESRPDVSIVLVILITALKKTLISPKQDPRNPLNWLDSVCVSVSILQTKAGQRGENKNSNRKQNNDGEVRKRSSRWLKERRWIVWQQLHEKKKKQKQKRNTTKSCSVATQLSFQSRVPSYQLGWSVMIDAQHDHNQMSADKWKHCCSHGNRVFRDMTTPQMDTGWASKVLKVKLNFSVVARHILVLQFLHATKLMAILLTCKWFYFGTNCQKKTK